MNKSKLCTECKHVRIICEGIYLCNHPRTVSPIDGRIGFSCVSARLHADNYFFCGLAAIYWEPADEQTK